MMTVKESELIQKESELLHLVEDSHKGKILEEISANEIPAEKKESL
jgi:hypothetical protein